MCLNRLTKLKIALAILVPYALLAVGSGFTHNHDGNALVAQRSIAPASHGFGHAISSCVLAAHGDRDDCPACSWAKANVSARHRRHTVDLLTRATLQLDSTT